MAAYAGDEESTEMLLSQTDINVNAQNDEKMTPLHTAVKMGSTRVVKILLSHRDTRTDIRDQNGNTPLMIAQNTETLTGDYLTHLLREYNRTRRRT